MFSVFCSLLWWLGWEPKGNQSKCFANDPIRHVHANIFIAKLRLDKKSTWNYISPKRGKDLAKWSPVTTASYRLLPESTISSDDAIKFKNCFPEGVVALVMDDDEETMAKIVNSREDTVIGEVLRHREFGNKVQLTRVYDQYICKYSLISFTTNNLLYSI